ncbi:hypothetical protein GCM10023082_29180 [Streptomyces tremellae]|uniref:Uncharacterized protein n=1 Tax=Streptomyces tremellae TaxID=1124239 RepID=A0ABP7F1L3_9ACTN
MEPDRTDDSTNTGDGTSRRPFGAGAAARARPVARARTLPSVRRALRAAARIPVGLAGMARTSFVETVVDRSLGRGDAVVRAPCGPAGARWLPEHPRPPGDF